MDADQFCYWLQGFVELTHTPQPSEAQWQAIKDHLQLVFDKKTPQYGNAGDFRIATPKISDLLYRPAEGVGVAIC